MADNLAFTYGQFIIATSIATALWGVTCMQTLVYFVTYGMSDLWPLKYLVTALFTLDLFHEVICIQGVWRIFIPRFGDLENISTIHMPFFLEPIVLSVVLTITHGFFGWRIWHLSKKRWAFAAILIPLMLGESVAGIFYVTMMIRRPSFHTLHTPGMVNLLIVIYILSTAIDGIIAITMCVLLWRSRTGLRTGDRMILRLINASVSTGMCTALFSLSIVVTGAVWRQGFIHAIGIFSLCPIYCNAVLANLNARKYIGRRGRVDIEMNSAIRFRSPTTTARSETVVEV